MCGPYSYNYSRKSPPPPPAFSSSYVQLSNNKDPQPAVQKKGSNPFFVAGVYSNMTSSCLVPSSIMYQHCYCWLLYQQVSSLDVLSMSSPVLLQFNTCIPLSPSREGVPGSGCRGQRFYQWVLRYHVIIM